MKVNLFRVNGYAALAFGVLIPLAETIRRWSQLTDITCFLLWFDDYLFGAFMIFAALKARRNPTDGEKYLAAAWGMATAGMFLSLAGQIQRLDQDDPAPISSLSVAWIKGILLAIFFTFLLFSLRSKNQTNRTN